MFRLPKQKESKFLIISLTPFTFLAGIILILSGQKPFLYLRSNGYDEYKIILGSLGKFIYHLMFILITRFSILIGCRESILMGKKDMLFHPHNLTFHGTKIM